MAQVSPILPHVAITMPVNEADAIATALQMTDALLRQEGGIGLPDEVLVFGDTLAAAVQSLRDVLNPENESAPADDDLAGAA